MAKIAYWLFIICFPVLLLTSTVRLGMSSTRIYEYGFDKYYVSQVTGLDRAQLSGIAKRLVDYFNSKVETPQIKVVKDGEEVELFHDYELIHLQDVKGLFRIDYRVQAASLAYIIIYALLFLLWRKGRWQDLAKGVRWGSALTLVLIAVLGIASIFSFEQLFIQFHLISFSNPYWMLDPSKDYLIMLFPEPFWQDIALFGGGTIAAGAFILGGIAWAVPFIYQRRKRRQISP
jgi:integral membrane protein (TIGR01906 family)